MYAFPPPRMALPWKIEPRIPAEIAGFEAVWHLDSSDSYYRPVIDHRIDARVIDPSLYDRRLANGVQAVRMCGRMKRTPRIDLTGDGPSDLRGIKDR